MKSKLIVAALLATLAISPAFAAHHNATKDSTASGMSQPDDGSTQKHKHKKHATHHKHHKKSKDQTTTQQ